MSSCGSVFLPFLAEPQATVRGQIALVTNLHCSGSKYALAFSCSPICLHSPLLRKLIIPFDHMCLKDNCSQAMAFTMWVLRLLGTPLLCLLCCSPIISFVCRCLPEQILSFFTAKYLFESPTQHCLSVTP